MPRDPHRLPLVSRLLTLEYNALICALAFNITAPPHTARVNNRYGGFGIAYDRLAFVDGEQDPWRGAGVHSPLAKGRESTVQRPFVLIEGAVHHWDENGVFANETSEGVPPRSVREVQAMEVAWVRAWLEEWRKERGG